MRILLVFTFGGLIVWGCKQNTNHSLTFGKSLGQIDQQLSEASGLAASVANPGFLWTINDSGNLPQVFLIDQEAKIKMICNLPGARNRDWEDIAIGAGPDPTKKYVYVGDIGDNWSQYDLKFIYRFVEPTAGAVRDITITEYDTLILRMPDGKRDAETLMIDPVTNDLFLISKTEKSVGLYTTHYPFSRDTIVLTKSATLPFTRIVAGSISPDGTGVLLKDYEKVYYWKRTPNEGLADLLIKKPVEVPYEREPQGEAITWSLQGTAFFTLSESTIEGPANLFIYEMKRR